MPHDPDRLWPRLGNDTVALPCGGGVFFRNDGDSFVFADPAAYALMDRLGRDLTGTRSLAAICDDYDSELRPTIVRLVHALLDRGLLRNDCGRERLLLPEVLRRQFASQIALLGHLADAPQERFQRFRQSRVLVAGSGLSFWHAAAALIRNGLEQLWLFETTQTGAGLSTVSGEVEALRRQGVSATVHVVQPGQEVTWGDAGPASLMVYAADVPSLVELALVGRRAGRDACPMLAGFVAARQTLLGPLVRAPGCFVCTLQRLVAELCEPPRRQALMRQVAEGAGRFGSARAVPAALAKRLGGDVAFEAFKVLAGHVRPEIERGAILQTAHGDDAVRAVFVPYTIHGCRNACRLFVPPEARAWTAGTMRLAAVSTTAGTRAAGPSTESAGLLFKPHGRDDRSC